ncbi:GNAT family N-acetyltransferase [Streptococcus pseudoporcinus]|uniref:Acetyltransferase, GNAT family n=1 Tax=Streptococcus pseudoporcinus TaxID=361101 RepID=A0A4U9XHS6_9STRE|nr:GNAT family N-acetyltransferase [Streptococcus pseudoporcinus]VTS12312.1 acetyltransferase, GNAT family [Streptococcus pseudoporcinus]VUC64838.1 acetyltransferase, GNAT family [Streptococcus pseudoporcinus]VUC95312.1 acetyltransferase, GNAT family [Streptococcus pseudoporcinus]VUC95611.1 acetyltransferase, GNAT family [Streptococcus pseudoporcinus]
MFVINTERLELKPMDRSFIDSTHRYASDKEANRYMLNLPNDSIKETEEFLLNCEHHWKHYSKDEFELEFAIIYSSKHVGGLSFTKKADEDLVEVGWILDRAFWHQGIAFEAAYSAISYFSETFQVNHFMAHCDSQNQASYLLMEKLGMKRISVSGGRLNKKARETTSEYLYRLDVS